MTTLAMQLPVTGCRGRVQVCGEEEGHGGVVRDRQLRDWWRQRELVSSIQHESWLRRRWFTMDVTRDSQVVEG